MLSLVMAVVLLAQATDPPPLPEDKVESPPPLEDMPGGNPVIDKYQDCIQKMIDSGRADNIFMRKCMGLNKPRKRPKSADAAESSDAASSQRAGVMPVVNQGLIPLKQCYEALLTKSKPLGLTPEGRIDAKFAIAPEGRVEALNFSAAGVNDVSFLECWRDRIGAWRFPAMRDKLNVHLAFQLAAAGQVKITIVDGFPKLNAIGFTTEELFNVFQKYAPEVRACYNQLLARKPQAGGQVGVEIMVDARGGAKRVSFHQLTVDDGDFKVCLSKSIKRWRFPKPRSGQDTLATYPAWTFSAPQVQGAPTPVRGGAAPGAGSSTTPSGRPGR